MASARVQPVARMTIPAMTVPMNPYRSVSTCRNAPWTFRLDRFARASTQAAAMLTTIPAAATATTGPPSTRGGWISRPIASAATMPAITSSVMPLPAADRISARFQPNVHAPAAGRAASRIAHRAAPIAPTSVSMCPASDSSASDPEAQRDDDLGQHERGQQDQGGQQVPAVSPGARRMGMRTVRVAVVISAHARGPSWRGSLSFSLSDSDIIGLCR